MEHQEKLVIDVAVYKKEGKMIGLQGEKYEREQEPRVN